MVFKIFKQLARKTLEYNCSLDSIQFYFEFKNVEESLKIQKFFKDNVSNREEFVKKLILEDKLNFKIIVSIEIEDLQENKKPFDKSCKNFTFEDLKGFTSELDFLFCNNMDVSNYSCEHGGSGHFFSKYFTIVSKDNYYLSLNFLNTIFNHQSLILKQRSRIHIQDLIHFGCLRIKPLKDGNFETFDPYEIQKTLLQYGMDK